MFISLFLVGAFLEKRARLLQWLVFFFFSRQTTGLIVYVPLFSTDFNRFTAGNSAVMGSGPCFSQKLFWAIAKAGRLKGPLFHFSLHCAIFSGKSFFVSEGRLHLFLIFCNKIDFQKARSVPLFSILKTLRFLSLRYSADFRRSRLVIRYKTPAKHRDKFRSHQLSLNN